MNRISHAAFALLLALVCVAPGAHSARKADIDFLDEFQEWDGEQLAKTHCSTCHLYPDTDLLPRESWPYLLDLMGLYFGYDDGELLSSLPSDAARAELFDVEKYPRERTLSPFQWAAVRDYYETADGAEPVDPPPEGEPLTIFETSLIFGDSDQPVSSLVKVASDGSGLYLGDAKSDQLVKYDSEGRITGREKLPGAVVHLAVSDEAEWATVIGSILPSNTATGSLWKRAGGQGEWQLALKGLHRPVRTLPLDFDGDQEEDLLINEFGHYRGQLSVARQSLGKLQDRVVLRSEPGSISSAALALGDGNGLVHALVMNAQARQEITLYRNLGNLEFRAEMLLQKPPSFGYTQLRLVDLTGDGEPEVVTINGDNADLPGPPLKGYHGVRVYRLREEERISLEEVAFLPVPGAFQAAFEDFDGNGFVDIAVVSFFPDQRRLEQRLVLCENRGALAFVRKSMPEGGLAPWMTVDAGDIDGDGDPDLVLGSGYVGREKAQGDSERRPAGMILRNRTLPIADAAPLLGK